MKHISKIIEKKYPKAVKLTLETDYKINGNSTGCSLDTLAIAVDGRDSNDIDENMLEAEYAAIDYVLEHYDYESDMLAAATKKELKAWRDDKDAYNIALAVFTDKLRRDSQDYRDSDTELAKELCEAVDAIHDENYKEWINGDYRDWTGILMLASRRYSEGEIEFTEAKGEVYATIPQSTIDGWNEENGYRGFSTEDGVKLTQKQAREFLERMINDDARAAYNKRTSEQAARKVERERLAAYKAEQAQAAEVERVKRLEKIIKSK